MMQRQTSSNSRSLGRIEIFANLAPDVLASIEKRCAWRSYDSGEIIIDYLDKSNDVFFIISGKARASLYSAKGKVVTFSDMGPSEMFGEYGAIDGAPRSASIEARTRCLIASMPGSAFRGLLQSQPTVAFNLIGQIVTRVRTLTTRIYEFSALAVNNRIQAEVLRLARLAPQTGGTISVDPAPIHADIATRTSTHREAVTRELNRLAKLGILERRGKVLIIKDVARLASMVHKATGE